MVVIDFNDTIIDKLITHHIGNKIRDEELRLSHQLSDFSQETGIHLEKYFLSSFKPENFYNFSHSIELNMNEVFTLIRKIFNDTSTFLDESKNIAKLLYEYTNHPNIKEGEFNLVYFKDVVYEDVILDAIGLFKSENTVPFIQMESKDKNFQINHDVGFDLNKIDKACIIFNIDEDTGYSILNIDNANKQLEAQYWINDFLQLMPSDDAYNNTKDTLSITKKFVTKELQKESYVSKTERIDMLNKTMDYFKSNEIFDKNDFANKVFESPEIIEAYKQYDNKHREELDIKKNDSFEISNPAVKKQARVYRSVLKLDKNFHVYIHGGKDMIEKGTDSDGRKYYKIFYENES